MFSIFPQFILTAVCVALPVPAGVFFPVFVVGEFDFSSRRPLFHFLFNNFLILFSCIFDNMPVHLP